MKVASNGGSEKEPDKNKIKQTNSLTAQGNDDTIEKLLKRSGGHRKENSTIKPVDFG